jgi:hypothetical protein
MVDLSQTISLATLKEEAGVLVEKVATHKDVPESTKQCFQNALDKLVSEENVIAWNIVARMPFPISSTCVECIQLKAKLNEIQRRLDHYEKQERDAVRRQIAINIEFEMKLMAMEKIEKFASLLQDSTVDREKEINQMDLNTLMKQLKEKDQQAICLKFNQTSYSVMKTVLYDMKEFSATAHPVTLFGKPVTYDVAKDIAAKTTRRNRRFIQSDLPDIARTRYLAESSVLGLYELRKKQPGWEEGQTLLFNCE